MPEIPVETISSNILKPKTNLQNTKKPQLSSQIQKNRNTSLLKSSTNPLSIKCNLLVQETGHHIMSSSTKSVLSPKLLLCSTSKLKEMFFSLKKLTAKESLLKNQRAIENCRTRFSDFSVFKIVSSKPTQRKLSAIHNLTHKPVFLTEEPLTEALLFSSKLEFLNKAAQLPFALQVFQSFQDNDKQFIVSEFCKHGSLLNYLHNHPPSPLTLKFLLYQILNGIQSFNDHSLLVFDFQWNDILIDENLKPRFKQLDFKHNQDFRQSRKTMVHDLINGPVFTPSPLIETKSHFQRLTVRKLGDLIHQLIRKNFTRNDSIKKPNMAKQVSFESRQDEHEDESFIQFASGFYGKMSDLSQVLQVALDHPFFHEAKSLSTSAKLHAQLSMSSPDVLRIFYVNSLLRLGYEKDFIEYCLSVKKNNPFKTGFLIFSN